MQYRQYSAVGDEAVGVRWIAADDQHYQAESEGDGFGVEYHIQELAQSERDPKSGKQKASQRESRIEGLRLDARGQFEGLRI